MLCGSKCFVVKMELNGTKQVKQVTARNSVGARKLIRAQYGTDVEVLSVKEGKRNPY
ncbi:hypothetical protein [Sporosarcina koreensis]|uniref:hypothetical protein n=1 Tax=Bacillales TaxID=1385 RepID=UPI000B0F6059|nr:hypothetical protein [Sporosarcina koreensis]